MRWFFLTILAFLLAYILVGSAFHYLLFREPKVDASQLPAAGDTVDNPTMGVRVTLQKTAADTDGEYVQAEVRLKPGGGPPPHVHPGQEVMAEVLSGELTMVVDDEERQLARGDTISVPAGTAHQPLNSGDRDTRIRYTIRPALDSDIFLVQFHSFAADTASTEGRNLFWQMMLFSSRYDIYSTDSPVFLQQVASFFLAPTARVLKHQSFYPMYGVEAKK
jgi:quercetin dioxygenase-like cupin family protein